MLRFSYGVRMLNAQPALSLSFPGIRNNIIQLGLTARTKLMFIGERNGVGGRESGPFKFISTSAHFSSLSVGRSTPLFTLETARLRRACFCVLRAINFHLPLSAAVEN
jgi:hypothetical protein